MPLNIFALFALPVMVFAGAVLDDTIPPQTKFTPNFKPLGLGWGGGEEASPIFFNGKLYIVQSEMGRMPPDGSQGGHSFFCVFDAITGEKVSCPNSSAGFAFCSSIIDRTSSPQRAWVFCSAWDRANHTVSGANSSIHCSPTEGSWGCGECALAQVGVPGVSCYVGAWSSTDLKTWTGPAKAVSLPGNVTVPNVGVSMIPANERGTPPAGVPVHQAFMALESSKALAVNIGTDGDLTRNWVLLNVSSGAFASHRRACPTSRYNPIDKYYYVFGGGDDITLTRSQDLRVWEQANTSMATGCISMSTCLKYRPTCSSKAVSYGQCCVQKSDFCSPTGSGQIAEGYFEDYWSNYSDCRGNNHTGCRRQFVANETAWNWSVNDADFTDENGKGPTRFIYDLSLQTKPQNFTGMGGGGYAVGYYPGSEFEWLMSYY